MTTTQQDAAVVALVALAEHGVPPDVQELLVHGDGRGTVAPGALAKMIAALSTAAVPPQVPDAGEEDMAWFSGQRRLSLSFYSPTYGDDDDQSEEWRVEKESGSINDRKWDIVGRGETTAQAISAARAALATQERG